MSPPEYDAIVVGAGFGGIYRLYSLKQFELKVLLLEAASEIGGTWYCIYLRKILVAMIGTKGQLVSNQVAFPRHTRENWVL